MTDLLTRLRQLARAEHDDLDVVDEAVEEIVNLRTDVHVLQEMLERYKHDSALQSQDREDAERYRWIAKQKDVWAVLGDEYNLASEYEGANNLTEAIDHARRVEGEGK